MSEETKKSSGFDPATLVASITKGNKIAGIILGLIMIVIGILLFAFPLMTQLGLIFIATIGLLIYGVFGIVSFIRTPSGLKNSGALAISIMWVIIGILLLFTSGVIKLETIAFVFGFIAIFSGINRFGMSGAVKKAGGPYGWVIASGIINLAMGGFFLIAPFATSWILDIFVGVYILIGGIMLLSDALAAKTA